MINLLFMIISNSWNGALCNSVVCSINTIL